MKPELSTLSARTRGAGRRVPRVAVSALSATAVLCAVAHPSGARASAGVPNRPAILFSEDFENNPAPGAIAVTSYTGPTPLSQTYKTDPAWASSAKSCNGWIMAFANAGICESPAANANVRLMARKLGVFAGAATPDNNHVVSAYTDRGADPGPNSTELETAKPVPLAGAGHRFLVLGADAAAANCANPGAQPTLIAFFLLAGSQEIPLAATPSNICTKGHDLGDGVRGGQITSNGAVLRSDSQVGVRLRNVQGSGIGNDHVLDNIRISDASPQLDKAFGSASVTRGTAAALIFTVTNTTDLIAKNGWGFTDKLPPGLRIADPNDAATSCQGGVVTATPGAQAVKVIGNLTSGQPSCTATVSVVGVRSGTVSNGDAQLTTVGLHKPAQPATVTVAEPTTGQSALAACSDGADNDGDGKVDGTDSGCVINGDYVPLKNSEAGIAPLAQCAGGALRLTDVYGRRGRTQLRGVAGPESVGATVVILSESGAQVATATVGGDLSFRTTAPLPSQAIRHTSAAGFQARLGRERSPSLRFARRLTGTVAHAVGPARVRIGGRVTAPLARPAAAVVVRATSQCRGSRFRGRVVARGIRVQPGGRWTATFTLPRALRGSRVFLRAETRVRRTTRNAKRVRTFSLVQGVALR